MFKKAISNIRPITTFITSAALLIGCSKGGNVPKNWDKDGVGTSRLKLLCASPHTFNTNAVNEFRTEKMAQMQALNLDQSAGTQNALLVIRTILTDLPAFDGQLPAQNLLELPRQHSSMQELNNSNQLIIAEKVNCEKLTGKYSGPGVNGEMIGKLKSISEKSIEIQGTDASGVLITVKVEKTAINRKKDPAGFQKAQQREDNGFTELTVTISRKLNGKDLTGAVITQKTVMNIEEQITVNQSVIQSMAGVVGENNIPSGIAQKLSSLKAQSAGLKQADTSQVTMTFSELMELKKAVVDMQPLEEVNVTSKKVPLVVIDEIKEVSEAPVVPAPPPTASAPAIAEPPVINPELSKDSFLQRYLKEVIGDARKEEKIQFDITGEAEVGTEDSDAADAAEAADAADADASAGQEAPAVDAAKPDAQKTNVPVTAKGKIISI